VRAILEPDSAADRAFPAALVAPETGRLMWMLDRSAAAGLTILHHEIRGDGQT
jgi:6-phosphogluconolactonase